MFAAAKTGKSVGAKVQKHDAMIRNRKKENFFPKKVKKYCEEEKRVLYLHPLKEEKSFSKDKKVHKHIELTA